MGAGETALKAKADAQIDARIAALNELSKRVAEMKKVSSTDKAHIATAIQTSIGEMTALKVKIDADTDLATLKTDIQSITKSYRVFALVLPKGRIEAAADRILSIVALMNTLETKLQNRITAAQTAGNNVASAQAALTDFHAKVADASTQAQAAVTATANLQPDEGNATTAASNNAALKSARTKIKAAIADLKAARQDAGTIVKALLSFKAPKTTNTNATTNTSAHTNTK